MGLVNRPNTHINKSTITIYNISQQIGIAKTGSGKSAAFVLPMIVHIRDQPELQKEEGPIGVICAPTRELAHQIYLEAKKFAKAYGICVSAVYGGMSKLEQFKELKAGCEIVVATLERLIDMLRMKALTMLRATYLVLDEADRMFDLRFEPPVRLMSYQDSIFQLFSWKGLLDQIFWLTSKP